MKRITLLIIFVTAHICTAQQKTPEFSEFYKQVLELEEQEEYSDAIKLLEENYNSYPDDFFELSKELLYLYRKTDQDTSCFRIWQEGHKRGYFYALLPVMKQYAKIKDTEEFKKLSAIDLELREKANEKSRMEYKVLLPEGYTNDKELPLLLVYHGGGSNIKRAEKEWAQVVSGKEMITVLIQSYYHFDYDGYGWPRHNEKQQSELKRVYAELSGKYNIDETKIYQSGISAGAAFALETAMQNLIPVKKNLLLCPAVTPAMFTGEELDNAASGKTEMIFILGKKDRFYDLQTKTEELFRNKGIITTKYILENAGHEYPDNFKQIFDAVLSIDN